MNHWLRKSLKDFGLNPKDWEVLAVEGGGNLYHVVCATTREIFFTGIAESMRSWTELRLL